MTTGPLAHDGPARQRKAIRSPLAVLIAAWLAAPSLLAGGCSVNVAPLPRATLACSVTPGPNGANCNRDAASFLSVGSFGNVARNEPMRSVENGGEEGEWIVSTSCSVVPRNDGFDVALSAQLIGQRGKIFTARGFFVPNAEPQLDLAVTFGDSEDRYAQKHCVARYATDEQTVAAGRVWAEVTCPSAAPADASRRRDGHPISCHAVLTLRFENCKQ